MLNLDALARLESRLEETRRTTEVLHEHVAIRLEAARETADQARLNIRISQAMTRLRGARQEAS